MGQVKSKLIYIIPVIIFSLILIPVGSSLAASIAITFPPDNVLGPQFFINGTATDTGNGIDQISVSIDNGPFNVATGTTNWSFYTSPLSCADHTITAKATDSLGNNQTTTITVRVWNSPVGICS